MKALSCLLNSKAYNYYYHGLVPETGRAMAEVKATYLKDLPLVDLSPKDVLMLSKMYSLYSENKDSANSTNELFVQKIDEFIYQLLELSKAETKQIEQHFVDLYSHIKKRKAA